MVGGTSLETTVDPRETSFSATTPKAMDFVTESSISARKHRVLDIEIRMSGLVITIFKLLLVYHCSASGEEFELAPVLMGISTIAGPLFFRHILENDMIVISVSTR